MASGNPRKRLQEEVTCPICLEYFVEPVTLPCEHSFCRACIRQSVAISPISTLCPLCKRTFCYKGLKQNWGVAGFIQLIKDLNGQEEENRREICGRHQEPLKLFCKDSKVLICTLCEKEHQDHNIVPVEEAVQQCRDRIGDALDRLDAQRERIINTASAREHGIEDFLKQMATEREKTAARFQEQWLFVKKQEYHTLARMKRTKNQMERKRDQHMDRLNQKLSALEDLIQEIEKKRKLPPSRLLQDIPSILKRSEQKMKMKTPSCFLPALSRKVAAFADSSAILERAKKEFEDSVAACY